VSGGTFDGHLSVLAAALDGEDGEVIVFGADYVPNETHQFVDQITDIIGREPVTLTVTLSAGEVFGAWSETGIEVDIDAAPIVGGWVLAGPGATDADKPILCWFDDFGGLPPDPYPVTIAGYAFRYSR
jgi:hypothetical protein